MAIESDVVVQTKYGALRGSVDGAVRTFKGVPYAAPPVGPLRWRTPQPLEAWQGTRDALEFGYDCPQIANPNMVSRAPGQSEDCLTLSVRQSSL